MRKGNDAAGVRGSLLGQPRAWPAIPFCTTKKRKFIKIKGLNARLVSSTVSILEKQRHMSGTSRCDRDTSWNNCFVTVRNQDQNPIPTFEMD